MPFINAGETLRYECDMCHTEFEVTYEPKAKGDPDAKKRIQPESVCFCPFCGEDSVSDLS